MTALDFSSFRDALAQLREGYLRAVKAPGDDLLRDGVIQRFEYSYELAHKMLKRWLERTEAASEGVDLLSYNGLIRLGSERGLLRAGLPEWDRFRAARNKTSHVYDGTVARAVFEVVESFLQEASHLFQQLEQRNRAGD